MAGETQSISDCWLSSWTSRHDQSIIQSRSFFPHLHRTYFARKFNSIIHKKNFFSLIISIHFDCSEFFQIIFNISNRREKFQIKIAHSSYNRSFQKWLLYSSINHILFFPSISLPFVFNQQRLLKVV